jgi:hypothetical protein
LKKSEEAKGDAKHKWNACINPDCKCWYFPKGKAFTTADMVNPLFYKDNSDEVPIYYCSDHRIHTTINTSIKNKKRDIKKQLVA